MIGRFAGIFLLAAAPASGQCEITSLQNRDATPGDFFGLGVALDGNTAVVSTSSGGAYVFQRTPSGWVELQKVTSASTGQGTGFGQRMALDGDHLLIGAIGDATKGTLAGAVVAFERVAGSWVEVQKLFASDAGPGHYFGRDLALDGDRVVIGGPRAMGNQSVGAAYVFEWNGASWNETALLRGNDTVAEDLFADRVDLSANRVVVGSRLSQSSGGWRAGSVYVFEEQAGTWLQMGAKLVGSRADDFGDFGSDVAIQGDRLAAGALGEMTEHEEGGAAYIFEWTGGLWVERIRLVPPPEDSDLYFRFGQGVDLDGSRLLITANPFQEAVYLFEGSGMNWSLTARLRSEPGLTGGGGQHLLGWSGALQGNTALIGEPPLGSGDGSAVVFSLPPAISRSCFCAAGPYCHDPVAGCRNSTARGAHLSACGSTSVTADDLLLHAWDVPANQAGLLVMGDGSIDLPVGDGRMCVGGSSFRYPIGSANVWGHRVFGPALAAFSQANFPIAGHIQAGDSWNFQYWFRDPEGYRCNGLQTEPGGSNWSNVVSVTFTL